MSAVAIVCTGSAKVAANDSRNDTMSLKPVAIIPGPPWPSTKKMQVGHEEEFDQPLLWRSPVQSNVSAQGGSVVFGPHVSVQVNVDGLGNNIPGDAANEPTIAIDRTNPNRIAIGWRQFDTVASNFRQAGVAYSTDAGQTWMFPGVLQPGQFGSDPVLGSDAFGDFFYSSLSSGASAVLFRSPNGGVNWTGPVNAFGGDKQWIAVDGRASGIGAGYIAEFWTRSFSCCPPNDFARSINHGVSFQSPIMNPQRMQWGTLDVDSTGTLYLCGATPDLSGHLFSRSIDAWNTAATPTFDFGTAVHLGGLTGGFGGFSGPNPAGLLGQVWLAAHPTLPGHVYILGSVAPPTPDPMDVMFIRSTDGGQTWSNPVRVNDDPVGTNAWQWFGTMSVAPSGQIDVVFNDTRLSGQANMSAVFYTHSFDGGQTWAPNVQVTPIFNSHIGFPQQDKIGDYYHMVSDDGGANLTYAATFNGEEDVYFLRIQRDCNGNTIDDDCDTACGAPGTRCDALGCGLSADCNTNAVPDDCEPDEDCNGNSIRDICEIGSNPALDCDFDRILDECEPQADCNSNDTNDSCDVFDGTPDCNDNGVPDSCDIDNATSLDRDGNGVPDECLGACCACGGGCSAQTASKCDGQFRDFGGLGTICADPGACEMGIPENDSCSAATNLPFQSSLSLPFDNRCSADDGPPTVNCPGGEPFGSDVWYEYTAPCTGTLRVSLCDGTEFDAILAVYGGAATCACPNDNTTLLTCGNDTCGVDVGPARVDLSVTAGRCYLIRVGGWGGWVGTGSLELQYLTPCTPPSPLLPEPNGVDKNRFISFVIPSFLAGSQNALRVRLTSLHHPAEPPDAPDFSAFEGQYRYVNTYSVGPSAVSVCTDSSTFGTEFRCAHLGCTPEYRDWATELGGEVLHVTGSEVVPSSTYRIALLTASCVGQEEMCPHATAPLQVLTGRWGDVQPGQLDVLDIAAIVDKVEELPNAMIEPRGLLHFQAPTPRTEAVNVLDISNVVDALKEAEYPYSMDPCP